jgi:hypothetical protein
VEEDNREMNVSMHLDPFLFMQAVMVGDVICWCLGRL